MRTNELVGPALDWAVAKCTNPEWWEDGYMDGDPLAALTMDDDESYSPSTEWAQGGPIIEREKIWVTHCDHLWAAQDGHYSDTATTPLIAAMRYFVSSRLGDEVEIPEELK